MTGSDPITSHFASRSWVRTGETRHGITASSSRCIPHASDGIIHSEAPAASPAAAAWRFTCLTYNILSDQYADQYAHWLYKDVPGSCIPWEHRRPLLLAELLHWAPDIMCLQVEGNEGDWRDAMTL